MIRRLVLLLLLVLLGAVAGIPGAGATLEATAACTGKGVYIDCRSRGFAE